MASIVLSDLEYRIAYHRSGMATITAYDTLGSTRHRLGELTWNYDEGSFDEPHAIDFVFVYADYRRRGLATELLRRAREIDPQIVHSEVRSWAGDAWARSTGDPLPPIWNGNPYGEEG